MMYEKSRRKDNEQRLSIEDEKEDLTIQFKIAFLEEIVGINEIDFDEIPLVLINYYIELKLRGLIQRKVR